MPWTVHATPPRRGWVYKPDHFPRTFAYKKEALAAAQAAKEQGGSGVRVEKQKK